MNYNFTDLYLGVHYRFRTGKFTFTPGFSYHSYRNKNIQLDTVVNDNFFKMHFLIIWVYFTGVLIYLITPMFLLGPPIPKI